MAIEAAGGAVWRRAQGAIEVLLVHRPAYDDWTLPKGKLDPDEAPEAAARREVEEETGLRCSLGPELATIRYNDHRGRLKVVRYWAMQQEAGAFAPNAEVDEVAWLPLGEAAERLTYGHDEHVLEALEEEVG